jgi:mannose-6-phosphate isomerase-like protein (cupin superfamily)
VIFRITGFQPVLIRKPHGPEARDTVAVMKHVKATKKKGLFKPLIESAAVQAAAMVLRPGQSSSDKVENEHPGAEQWLFVVSGSGRATVGRRSVRIGDGSLLLIEKGEAHRITNTGDAELVTVNFYAPPAYSGDGEVRRSVKSRKR